MQNDVTGKIEKYKAKCHELSNGQKLITGRYPDDSKHTTLQFRQGGKFVSSATDYSIYETPKSFVKNEMLLDKDLNHRAIHTYRRKTPNLEQQIYSTFEEPVKTKKYGRVFQNHKSIFKF